jgi:hypothetical protein
VLLLQAASLTTLKRVCLQIKVCGICCLLSAVLCVIVTVTTTVIHMNRLQTLRECVYTQKNHACTCYSGLAQDPSVNSEEGESK